MVLMDTFIMIMFVHEIIRVILHPQHFQNNF